MVKLKKSNKKGGGTLIMGLGFCIFLFTLTAIVTDMGMILLAKNEVKLANDSSIIGGTAYGKKGTETTSFEYNVDSNGNPIPGTEQQISKHKAIYIEKNKAKSMATDIFKKNTSGGTFAKNSRIDNQNIVNFDDESGGTFAQNSSTQVYNFFGNFSEVLSGDNARITVSTKSEVSEKK